jgi:hypothetical protein
MINEKERAEKVALAELKERISHFLYRNFIDFERDKGVIIKEQVLQPSFFLNKHGIIIDCFKVAEPDNNEFSQRAQLYIEDNVKFLPLDLRVLASKNVDQALGEMLPKLGCELNKKAGLTF